MNQSLDGVLHFPCTISIKAIGKKEPNFDIHVAQIIRAFYPNLSEKSVLTRSSKNDKYLSVTVKTVLQSREQGNQIYQALTEDPKIIMAI